MSDYRSIKCETCGHAFFDDAGRDVHPPSCSRHEYRPRQPAAELCPAVAANLPPERGAAIVPISAGNGAVRAREGAA